MGSTVELASSFIEGAPPGEVGIQFHLYNTYVIVSLIEHAKLIRHF
jgi:hypothetical protein